MRHLLSASACALLATTLAACHRRIEPAAATPAAPATASRPTPSRSPQPAPAPRGPLAGRPYVSRIPFHYDPAKPTPLMLLLHGYGSSAAAVEEELHIGALADDATFLLAIPDGTVDRGGSRFWNATDACCDFAHTGVDDVSYLSAVIDDMERRYHVDRRRVYVVGLSNGGFMAERLACEIPQRIAAVVSVAGDGPDDAASCRPAVPVAVLHIHADGDPVVPYGGGSLRGGVPGGPAVPSARADVAAWAARDGCSPTPDTALPRLDIDDGVIGLDTSVTHFGGCRGGGADLWTVHASCHIPDLGVLGQNAIWRYLQSHPKP